MIGTQFFIDINAESNLRKIITMYYPSKQTSWFWFLFSPAKKCGEDGVNRPPLPPSGYVHANPDSGRKDDKFLQEISLLKISGFFLDSWENFG